MLENQQRLFDLLISLQLLLGIPHATFPHDARTNRHQTMRDRHALGAIAHLPWLPRNKYLAVGERTSGIRKHINRKTK